MKDFEVLVSLDIFNSRLMNDAVYKFKRYEDSSLSYTGISKHEGKDIGLYDTVLKREESGERFENMDGKIKIAGSMPSRRRPAATPPAIRPRNRPSTIQAAKPDL